jgi:predicted nucleic acid-binding protein
VILADTSAWVEFDRATGSTVHLRLKALISAEGPLATTEPVIAEVASGARTDQREHQLRRLLASAALVPFDATQDFDGAVGVYRRCRAVGVTPRGLLDCMIAAVALRRGAALLAQDVDLARIAEVVGLALDGATPRTP